MLVYFLCARRHDVDETLKLLYKYDSTMKELGKGNYHFIYRCFDLIYFHLLFLFFMHCYYTVFYLVYFCLFHFIFSFLFLCYYFYFYSNFRYFYLTGFDKEFPTSNTQSFQDFMANRAGTEINKKKNKQLKVNIITN
jgi:hypothetical protein